MSRLVVHGAALRCSQGSSPSTLTVLPSILVEGDDVPMATVMDFVPLLNVGPCGMCRSPSNPQVASATAAAQGVLTPMPCLPVLTGPWSPGSPDVTLNELAALTEDARASCAWGGAIEITNPGTNTVENA